MRRSRASVRVPDFAVSSPESNFTQSRLARAIAPEQRNAIAGCNRQLDAFEHGFVAITDD